MPGSRRAASASQPGRGIRWDRVSRMALLFVLALIVYLYAGPARSFVSTLHAARGHRAAVLALQHENLKLRDRKKALANPKTLALEARRLGMVAPGERAYVVRGLPKGR